MQSNCGRPQMGFGLQEESCACVLRLRNDLRPVHTDSNEERDTDSILSKEELSLLLDHFFIIIILWYAAPNLKGKLKVSKSYAIQPFVTAGRIIAAIKRVIVTLYPIMAPPSHANEL